MSGYFVSLARPWILMAVVRLLQLGMSRLVSRNVLVGMGSVHLVVSTRKHRIKAVDILAMNVIRASIDLQRVPQEDCFFVRFSASFLVIYQVF